MNGVFFYNIITTKALKHKRLNTLRFWTIQSASFVYSVSCSKKEAESSLKNKIF